MDDCNPGGCGLTQWMFDSIYERCVYIHESWSESDREEDKDWRG